MRAPVLRTLLALLGAAALTPLTASADGDVDAAVFAGQVTTNPSVELIGGGGQFNFTALTPLCQSIGTDLADGSCSIVAAGVFSNIVCGTGSVTGVADYEDFIGGDSVSFVATFVAGLGAISGGATGVVQLVPTTVDSPPFCTHSFDAAGMITIT